MNKTSQIQSKRFRKQRELGNPIFALGARYELLNFGYHNAHHELMKCPWHSLHELDRELYTGNEKHYITLPELLSNYHRFRLSRIFTGQGKAVDDQGDRQLETFYGGIEVSFLVLP